MVNKIASGEVFNVVVAGSAIAAGDVVEMTDLVGVAVSGGAVGDTIAVNVCGVYEVAKKTAEVFTQGQKLYWIKASNELTTDPDPAGSPGSAIFAGYAYEAAALNDTTAKLRLVL